MKMILDFIVYVGLAIVSTVVAVIGTYICYIAIQQPAYYQFGWIIFNLLLFFGMWIGVISCWQIAITYLREMYFK
jgi:hypothetical protein